MSDRDKIRERIRLLRERTTARGCTEAEALAAAGKVAQLMLDYGLSEGDIAFDEQSSRSAQKGGSPKAALWPVIAWCTSTAVVVIERMHGADVTFVGRAPGPELAVYLRDVCERAVDRAVRDFKKGRFYRARRGLPSKRAAVNAFTTGMVGRLNQRLQVIFGPSVSREAYDEAARELDLRYAGNTDTPPPRVDLRHIAAAAHGWMAGEKVTLAHGVGGVATPLQIGGV
ncbi:MAG: DUF2786 domain-containing protein [Rhizobiaceae bacterium]|nr:DUF2786 domain-containing protein [Rhizobiaceae bacterium]